MCTSNNILLILILSDIYPDNCSVGLSIKLLLSARWQEHWVKLWYFVKVSEPQVYLIDFKSVSTKKLTDLLSSHKFSIKDQWYKPKVSGSLTSCHYTQTTFDPTEWTWHQFHDQQDVASLVPKYCKHSSTSDLKWRSWLPSPTVFWTVGCCSLNVRIVWLSSIIRLVDQGWLGVLQVMFFQH